MNFLQTVLEDIGPPAPGQSSSYSWLNASPDPVNL